jgi:tetratricopeptide (TPR) repeat protein
LLDFPEPHPDEPVAQQVRTWAARADIYSNQQQFEDAIRARKAAIKLSPEDYPEDRVLLAHLYTHLGRVAEAVELYEQAYSSLSDKIVFVEMFELLMTREGKSSEVEKLTSRVYELERIYRRK